MRIPSFQIAVHFLWEACVQCPPLSSILLYEAYKWGRPVVITNYMRGSPRENRWEIEQDTWRRRSNSRSN